jgi:mRNA-degrading endonuclease RelE of RelBE toxin-antitoxin system
MRVFLTPSAQKNFKRIPQQEQKKIAKKLIELENNAYTGKRLEGELKGYLSLKAWPYRILYDINKDEQIIQVHKIAHRQGAYN